MDSTINGTPNIGHDMRKTVDSVALAVVTVLLVPVAVLAWALMIIPWDVLKPSGGRG